jgi:hypothetical protein
MQKEAMFWRMCVGVNFNFLSLAFFSPQRGP